MSILTYTYMFSGSTIEPPTGNQVRFDQDIATGTTKIWVRYLTSDGIDAFVPLMSSAAGWTIWTQDKDDHTKGARFIQTGPPIDKGGYVELPVVIDVDSAPLVSQQIILGLQSPDVVAPIPPAPTPPSSVPYAGAYTYSSFPPRWSARVIGTVNDDDVLTVAELKERARVVPGDDESDELLKSYIAAARQQVERDTGCALPTQTLLIEYGSGVWGTLLIPYPPLQEVLTLSGLDANGIPSDIDIEDPAQVLLINTTAMPGRVVFGASFGSYAAVAMSVTAGWTKDTLPPLLKFAVGLLAAHYLTAGRDRVVIGTIVGDMPAGYAEAIQAYRLEVLV